MYDVVAELVGEEGAAWQHERLDPPGRPVPAAGQVAAAELVFAAGRGGALTCGKSTSLTGGRVNLG